MGTPSVAAVAAAAASAAARSALAVPKAPCKRSTSAKVTSATVIGRFEGGNPPLAGACRTPFCLNGASSAPFLVQRRLLASSSSPPSSSSSTASTATSSSRPAVTLRRLSSPFLLLCHPDRTPLISATSAAGSLSTSTSAREANLRAVQSLNGLIDAVEAIYDRASDPASPSSVSARGGRVDLSERLEIEFLVPSSGPAASADGSPPRGIRKPKSRHLDSALTRRCVALTFPREMVEQTQRVDVKGRYDLGAAERLRDRAGEEVVRLLRAAGCGVPEDYRAWKAEGRARAREREEWGEKGNGGGWKYGVADVLAEELDLDGRSRAAYGGSPRFSRPSHRYVTGGQKIPLTKYQESRRRFMDSVDWKAERKSFDRLWEDALANYATEGLVNKSEVRRTAIVEDILGRVRVDGGATEGKDPGGEEGADKAEECAEAEVTNSQRLESLGLGPVGQLIALRRLSLLLTDNFADLEMEELGRMWEGLTIVLIPERRRLDDPDRPPHAPPRPLKKRGRVRESGFKFAYESDARVTAYVPVDFEDKELLNEFKHHLGEYWMNHCGLYDGWFEELLPSTGYSALPRKDYMVCVGIGGDIGYSAFIDVGK